MGYDAASTPVASHIIRDFEIPDWKAQNKREMLLLEEYRLQKVINGVNNINSRVTQKQCKCMYN